MHESYTGAVIFANNWNQVEVTVTARLFKSDRKTPVQLSDDDFMAITRLYSGNGNILTCDYFSGEQDNPLCFYKEKNEYCKALKYPQETQATGDHREGEPGEHSVTFYLHCRDTGVRGYDVYVQFDGLNTTDFPTPPNTSGDDSILKRCKLHIEAQEGIDYSDSANWKQPDDIGNDTHYMEPWSEGPRVTQKMYVQMVRLFSKDPYRFLYEGWCFIDAVDHAVKFGNKNHGEDDHMAYTPESCVLAAAWGQCANIWLVGGMPPDNYYRFCYEAQPRDIGLSETESSYIYFPYGDSWIGGGPDYHRQLSSVENNAFVFHRFFLWSTLEDIRTNDNQVDDFLPEQELHARDEYGNSGELLITWSAEATNLIID